MRGKNKCKILKQIRQKIADENDIPLVTQECTYQGECSGTCPRCEAELRYLEQQLARRQAVGKAVTVAALSVSLMAGAAGCSPGGGELQGDVPYISAPDTTAGGKNGSSDSLVPLPDGTECATVEGTVNWNELGPEDLVLGQLETRPEDEITELEGDVAYIPLPEDTETAGAPPAPVEGEQSSEPGMLEAVGGNG